MRVMQRTVAQIMGERIVEIPLHAVQVAVQGVKIVLREQVQRTVELIMGELAGEILM